MGKSFHVFITIVVLTFEKFLDDVEARKTAQEKKNISAILLFAYLKRDKNEREN